MFMPEFDSMSSLPVVLTSISCFHRHADLAYSASCFSFVTSSVEFVAVP